MEKREAPFQRRRSIRNERRDAGSGSHVAFITFYQKQHPPSPIHLSSRLLQAGGEGSWLGSSRKSLEDGKNWNHESVAHWGNEPPIGVCPVLEG